MDSSFTVIEKWPDKSESVLCPASFSMIWTLCSGVPEGVVMVPEKAVFCGKAMFAENSKMTMTTRAFSHEWLGSCDGMPGHERVAFIFTKVFKTVNR